MTILYLVIPCYNEQEVLCETARRLQLKMKDLIQTQKISAESRVVFVNDGSSDKTWDEICSLYESDPLFGGINLSCNKGHQNALMAGLMTVRDSADAVISLDADLQDDINVIDEMLEKFHQGSDVVYGVRRQRRTDSAFKRLTAEGYYKFMRLLGARLVFNHADYRLLSRRALKGLSEYKEVNLFLRGIVPMIGYPSSEVYYDRNERFAGTSKYPLRKMIAFAWEGITSLTISPIRFIAGLGAVIFCASIFMLIYSVVQYFIGATVAGWASIVVSIWAIGGLQLLAIGVVGEYIGKIYYESKRRPLYIVEEVRIRDHAKKREPS